MVPKQYADIKLCLEWGISWDNFKKQPYRIIAYIRECFRAEQEGLKHKETKDILAEKAKERLNKINYNRHAR